MTDHDQPHIVQQAEAVLLKPLPDAPQRHPVALAIEGEAMAIYHPQSGNDHAPEWVPDARGRIYLGVSTLVKKPAQDYAVRLMLKREDEPEDGGYWARRGNLAAWDHTRRITPYRENQVRWPLDLPLNTPPEGRWTHPSLMGVDLVGHIDGIRVSGEDGENLSFSDANRNVETAVHCARGGHVYITPLECKLFEAATDDKVDIAARQVMCYSAILARLVAAMPRFAAGELPWPFPQVQPGRDFVGDLPLAAWHDAEQDPHARSLDLTALGAHLGYVKVLGGSVHIDQGREGKGFVQFVDDLDMPERVFAWLTQKAAAIMVSVRAYWASEVIDEVRDPTTGVTTQTRSHTLTVDEALAWPGGVMDYLASPLGVQEFQVEAKAIDFGVEPGDLLRAALEYEVYREMEGLNEANKKASGARACAAIFSARDPDGRIPVDKTGGRLRTLTVDLPDGSGQVKVTASSNNAGRTYFPKVTIKNKHGKDAATLLAEMGGIEPLGGGN